MGSGARGGEGGMMVAKENFKSKNNNQNKNK